MGKRDVRLHPQDRQTQRSEKLSGPAQTLDRGTHLRLAQLLQTTLQRLRTPPQLSRNHDSHRLRPPTPQAIPLVFRQVLRTPTSNQMASGGVSHAIRSMTEFEKRS